MTSLADAADQAGRDARRSGAAISSTPPIRLTNPAVSKPAAIHGSAGSVAAASPMPPGCLGRELRPAPDTLAAGSAARAV